MVVGPGALILSGVQLKCSGLISLGGRSIVGRGFGGLGHRGLSHRSLRGGGLDDLSSRSLKYLSNRSLDDLGDRGHQRFSNGSLSNGSLSGRSLSHRSLSHRSLSHRSLSGRSLSGRSLSAGEKLALPLGHRLVHRHGAILGSGATATSRGASHQALGNSVGNHTG